MLIDFFFKKKNKDNFVVNKKKIFVISLEKYINFFEKRLRKSSLKNLLFFRNKLFLRNNVFIKRFPCNKTIKDNAVIKQMILTKNKIFKTALKKIIS